jgi:hypothetical protein
MHETAYPSDDTNALALSMYFKWEDNNIIALTPKVIGDLVVREYPIDSLYSF